MTNGRTSSPDRRFFLSEFLEKKASDFELPKLSAKALVHGHCHHKSLMKMTDEESFWTKMGIDWSAPAPGCCGMAGSFGFDEDKYEVSIAIGELEFLPAVRQAPPESLIIADGFSCREQIAQSTDRQALHLAEVIAMALRGEPVAAGSYPEKRQVERRRKDLERSMKRAGVGLAAVALAPRCSGDCERCSYLHGRILVILINIFRISSLTCLPSGLSPTCLDSGTIEIKRHLLQAIFIPAGSGLIDGFYGNRLTKHSYTSADRSFA